MEWFSLLLPLGYLTILTISLFTFSHLYRARQATRARSLLPWFPAHLTRDVYLTLLELQASPSSGVAIPDSILKAALLRRATADIHRVIALRAAKPALAQLLQRGGVGDELWARFTAAEQDMDAELRDVVAEANALAPSAPAPAPQQQPQQQGQQLGWGQTIFQSAGECAHNELLRAKLAEMEASRKGEVEAWVRRRESVREGFMRELEADAEAAPRKGASSSEEDGVIVEGGGPAAAVAGQDGGEVGGGGGGASTTPNSKRKGRK